MYRIAFLSYHTSPLAPLGGPQTGGLNLGACPERSEGSAIPWTDRLT